METSRAGTKPSTHYEVLNLIPALLDSQNDPSTLIKQAYRRALLRHHPDKTKQQSFSDFSPSQQPLPQTPKSSHPVSYTVDQITQAFTILSSPRQRSDYDQNLRLSRAATSSNGDDPLVRFQTGIEIIDLDDLAFDEQDERWHRSCRCGNERGFSFQEADLEEVEHEGVLMVGCQDCSLWLKVHFAVIDDIENDRH